MTGDEAPAVPVRVLVVDDHAFIRAQVTEILNAHQDIEVVGECDDGSRATELAARTRPHVVVMDFRMPEMSGIEATRRLLLANPEVRVLILTGSLSHHLVSEAGAAGAVGLLSKGDQAEGLVAAVRRVAAGGTVWPALPVSPSSPFSA